MLFFKKFFPLLVGIIIALLPLYFVLAMDLDWPPSPMGTDLTASSTLTNLIQYLYEWGIALGGLAAFIALLIAGFLYLTSVGDPTKMADARGRIIWALAGLVLLLAAWIVLNTINPDLTTLQQLEVKPVSTITVFTSTSTSQYTCKSVEIKIPTATTTIAIDECKDFDISTSTALTAITTPGQCSGSLFLYNKTTCDLKDLSHTLPLNGTTTYTSNFNIKSIKLLSY